METKEHIGDFTCIENGAFRTFYMTCKCGWSSPVKVLTGGISSYYLHNMWLAHVADKQSSQGAFDCKLP
jgi:hypothetical protein